MLPVTGARYRKIAQSALDETHHLIAPCLGTDEIGVLPIVAEQPVLVGGELEEIALLLDPLHGRAIG